MYWRGERIYISILNKILILLNIISAELVENKPAWYFEKEMKGSTRKVKQTKVYILFSKMKFVLVSNKSIIRNWKYPNKN